MNAGQPLEPKYQVPVVDLATSMHVRCLAGSDLGSWSRDELPLIGEMLPNSEKCRRRTQWHICLDSMNMLARTLTALSKPDN